MATIGQQLLQPEAGWKRYDDISALINYSNGQWVRRSGTGSSGYNATDSYSDSVGAKIKIVTNSNKIRLMSVVSNQMSNNITIRVNGITETMSEYSSNVQWQTLVFEKTEMTEQYNVIELENNGGAYLGIDSIDVDANKDLIRYDYLDSLLLDENMRKYGALWFGFDEESGNVLDKLDGSYVGTLFGNPQRVDGWDGKGKAINLNGSNQYVNTTNAVNPLNIGEKTIRLKFKPSSIPTDTKIIFSTTEGSSAYRGVALQLMKDMTLNLFGYNGSTYNIALTSHSKLTVNKWHDIVLTFDGASTGDKVTMYINGKKDNTVRLTASDSVYSTILMLGRYPSAPFYVNGQIDEFQVLLKALTPEDFDKKVVAIKTADNKIISLPNLSGRVKEIPSEDELDLANLGYTWKDSDNSISSDGVVLTQPTIEYEVVGKNNVVLGNGKMFTLPISNFKKVTVENNE